MSEPLMTRAPRHPLRLVPRFLCLFLLAPPAAWAAAPQPGPPLTVRRASGPIVLDGNLGDEGWKGIEAITTWFETRVGDNVEPQVKNEALLAYDENYLYAGFRFEDPDPRAVRAPLGDHDAVPSSTDYAGVIVDSRNDGKTAQMFLSNPRGVQYDAVSSDVSGEDNAPDYYWDSIGRITETGWNLEIRIPFSSLRYSKEPAPTWGLLLYRNYPRDRRYQFFTARLPRDVNCFICNSSKLTGLDDLPHGSHLVVAPYATAAGRASLPSSGLGSPLENEPGEWDGGVDVKWNPLAGAAIDVTINPDFSQIEADAAQIAANERFALFYPEKRPFFLEGVDLFSTPMQAVYTRTITSPRGGVRATGRFGKTAFTALATQDRGGGVVILPGPQGSDDALQDFRSDVGVARLRRDFGQSFASVLATGREIEDGGYNRVIGPDFQWRPRPSDSFTGQALWSDTRTPHRPDLAGEWDGRSLADRAFLLYWSHSTPKLDWFVQGLDIGPDFRADNGFIPQVGYREAFLEAGFTLRPTDAFLSRARFFTVDWVDLDVDDNVVSRRASAGIGADGKWNSFLRLELNSDDIRVGTQLLHRLRPRVYLESSPGRLFNFFTIDTYFGEEIDFDNAREGTGATLIGTLTVRPSDHLELRANASRRWLDVDDPATGSGRLFTAEVERLRATWSFNSRSFVRLIGQYLETTRDTALYTFTIAPKSAGFTGSALFAYKVNWQTVLYLGYGDDRAFTAATDRLEERSREVFLKISYAWQR
jgi:hypothetical protein